MPKSYTEPYLIETLAQIPAHIKERMLYVTELRLLEICRVSDISFTDINFEEFWRIYSEINDQLAPGTVLAWVEQGMKLSKPQTEQEQAEYDMIMRTYEATVEFIKKFKNQNELFLPSLAVGWMRVVLTLERMGFVIKYDDFRDVSFKRDNPHHQIYDQNLKKQEG